MKFPSIQMLKIEYRNKWIDDYFMIDRIKKGKNTEDEFKQITGKEYKETTTNEN